MKKKKIILLHIAVFICVVNSFTMVPVNAQVYIAEHTKAEDILKNNQLLGQKNISLGSTKENIKNKKSLKKEIQNRKKYHKNLLSMYNMNFDPKYLELIHQNSLILQQLEIKKI